MKKLYSPLTTEIALKMALEIEDTLNTLGVFKTISLQEQQAISRLNKKLNGLFSNVFEETIDRFDSLGHMPSSDSQRKRIINAISEAGDDYKEIAATEGVDSARRGYLKEVSTLRVIGLDVVREDMSKRIVDLIRAHSFIASDLTISRITGDVMGNLAKSYEEGLGIKEARERLRTEFADIKTNQLNTIARTETISLQNEGQYTAKQENNVEYHQWWTGQDERVRGNPAGLYPNSDANHWELHGQIVKVGDKFSNGLLYPGDRSGGQSTIEEWINCRCHDVTFIMPEGYMAPPGKAYFYEDELVEYNPNGRAKGEFETGEVTEEDLWESGNYWKAELGTGSRSEPIAATKDRIARKLSERLKNNDNFNDYVFSRINNYIPLDRDAVKIPRNIKTYKDYKKLKNTISKTEWAQMEKALDSERYYHIKTLIQHWAATSGDSDKLAISIQLAAKKEFNLKNIAMPWEKRFTELAKEVYGGYEDAFRAFLRAQYDITQEWFKEKGINHVYLMRGANWDKANLPKTMKDYIWNGTPARERVQLQPLSSFSTEADTAYFFGDVYSSEYQCAIGAKVSSKRILSSCQTGFGARGEAEMVVLGGSEDVWWYGMKKSLGGLDYNVIEKFAAASKL